MKPIDKPSANKSSPIIANVSLGACFVVLIYTQASNAASILPANPMLVENSAPINYFPVESVIQKIKTESTFEMIKRDDQDNETVTWQIEPVGSAYFNSKSVLKASEESVVRFDNASSIKRVFYTDYFYSLNPFIYYGYIQQPDEYAEVTMHYRIPQTALIGDSGLFAIEDRYSNVEKELKGFTYKYSWSLLPASATTAWLCQIIEAVPESEVEYSFDDSLNECYEIDNEGNIIDAKMLVPFTEVSGDKGSMLEGIEFLGVEYQDIYLLKTHSH